MSKQPDYNETFLMLLQAVVIGYLQKNSIVVREEEYSHILFTTEQLTKKALKKLTGEN